MRKNRTDVIVLFYSNDGCPMCERWWPIYEKVASEASELRFGSVNMDFNEVSYLETMGSLPVFYPVVRYFHGTT